MHDHLYHAQNKEGIRVSAWVRRGKLEDLFLSDSTIGNFIPESIFWGKVQKSLKGTGVILYLFQRAGSVFSETLLLCRKVK